MKIRLMTGYPLLERVVAHGYTARSRWWVAFRPQTLHGGITIVILPDADLPALGFGYGALTFHYPFEDLEPDTLGALLKLSTIPWLPNSYPPALSEAVCLTFHRQRYVDGFMYCVNRQWVKSDASANGYHYVTDGEIVEFCREVAGYLCWQILEKRLKNTFELVEEIREDQA